MYKKGSLIVLSGPSGVGKSTLVANVMAQYPNLKFSVSATTRDMRPGEVDGVNYFFVSRDKFQSMVENGELLEHAEYAGNCYGTPERPIREALDKGFDVLLDIEVQGAAQVLQKCPDAVSVFVMAPSFSEMERRLRGRGDTPEDKIIKRLATAREEVKKIPNYNYLIIIETNGTDRAADELLAVIKASKCRTESVSYDF